MSDDNQKQAQPQAYSGSLNKELGSAKVSDFIKPSEVEPDANALKELRIEASQQEKINLTDEHKSVGMSHAKESTPTPSSPSGLVQLPMTEEEAREDMKTRHNDDTRKWYDALYIKVLEALKLSNSKN